MKNQTKKLIIGAVFVMLMICMLCMSVSAYEETGRIGDNITYTYYPNTKQVVISGEGKTYNFQSEDDYFFSPFHSNAIGTIESVIIEDSVTSIGSNLFYNCEKLKSVIIPDSVTHIYDGAFWNCSSLTDITIPDSVTYIGFEAFENCRSLESVRIPNGITAIHWDTFHSCSSLTSVTLPDTLTHISEGAFSGCYNLTSIALPKSVIAIGDSAFNGCGGLTDLIIPDNTTIIGYCAFYACYNLKKITIPDSVTSIDSDAFDYCTNLTDVYYLGSQTQWEEISVSSGNEYLLNATIHFSIGTEIHTDMATGIKVKYNSDAFNENAELTVTQTVINANFVFGDIYDRYIPYNICFNVNGVEVQPNGTVTINIPVPADYNVGTLAVYYIDTNANTTLIPGRYEDGYFVFETDHFSEYVLVDESSKATDEPTTEPDTPDEPDTSDCSHLCHKSGFMGFIWKIVQFFWELFKINPVCECGIAHY
ncbi:MAG: leucine-rich repeat domain-containing protein [Clostridia bacterium]|nr:leucine-rich repeat domain-containing protein [Clostridia bacterium]